ncbi:hypothetical protein RhiirA4_485848 [Rhizophagus irregularis]|uniref:Uncharacterized protein n=1 Tax=Rhizophagus irregularis TaxID=588596 RepID=A0A2I1HQN2_9GLOM|nr:hypothetical protein RhiirA4_474937 [Rhizophagus irregularis]PKY61199.1 hypothetical protein RhiirA4_485848 [Rhizophagus irregularis]
MSMSDIESMSNDCSDSDLFTEEFLENIPDGCDLSDNEENVRNPVIDIQREDCQKTPDLKDL